MAGYFDHAATSGFHPPVVKDVILKLLNASIGSSGRSSGAVDVSRNVRNQIKLLIGVDERYEVVFTSTATEALNTILKGIVSSFTSGYCEFKGAWERTSSLEEGAVSIMHTPFCHNSVLRPLYHLEKMGGIERLLLKFNDFDLDLDRARMVISERRPNVIIFPAVGNVFGNVLPSKQLCEIVRTCSPETIIVVDCAQAVGVQDLSSWCNLADFIVFAGHKTLLGLPGCSGFVTNTRVLPTPLIHGGTGVESASHDNPLQLPDRYEAGTRNIYALEALGASVSWILEQGIDKLREHELNARQRLLELLHNYQWIHPILQNTENQGALDGSGIVSVTTDYLSVDETSRLLFEQGIVTRSGLECSPLAHKHMGTAPGGTLRFSVNIGTSDEDFDALERALTYINEGLGL